VNSRITDLKYMKTAQLVLTLLLLLPAARADADWLSGWSFRREIILHGPGVELVDQPVRIMFDNADTTVPDFQFSHGAPRGDDLRLTGADGDSLLDLWIEEWADTLQRGIIWARVPLVPDSGQASLYLYYGNPQAERQSNGDSLFLFYDGFEFFEIRMNAPDSLGTPTYEGSGQAVHPDVVHFPGGWGSPNAYKYWMMMTPYPDGNEDYENPSLLVSQDGLDWQVPPGVTNPLQAGDSTGYTSDPDMLFADGQLRAYYCYSAGAGGDDSSRVITFSSDNGVSWSDTTQVLKAPNYLISPTLLYQDSTYLMWYVKTNDCWSDTSTVHRRTSPDGLDWGPEQGVDLNMAGWVIWHLDVQRTDSNYVMLVAAYPEETSCVNTTLFWAQSSDGDVWSMDPRPILKASLSGWDEDLIYRSSFLIDGELYRIWYSGRRTEGGSGEEFWHLGYTQGTLDEFFDQGANRWDQVVGDAGSSTDFVHNDSLSLRIGSGGHSEVYKYLSGQISFNGWFYDQLDTTASGDSWLTLYDSQHIIGVGVFIEASDSNYSYGYYISGGWETTETGIPRTEGWHKLSINVFPDSSELLVDDLLVGDLDVLNSADIERIELEGHGWFDDIYVRDFAFPPPSFSVAEEQWPFAVTDLRGQLSGGDVVRLIWSPLPGATAYWIYRSLNDPATKPDTIFGVSLDTTWVDTTGAAGDPEKNFYYLVVGWNGSMVSENSQPVGLFNKSTINETGWYSK